MRTDRTTDYEMEAALFILEKHYSRIYQSLEDGLFRLVKTTPQGAEIVGYYNVRGLLELSRRAALHNLTEKV